MDPPAVMADGVAKAIVWLNFAVAGNSAVIFEKYSSSEFLIKK